VFRRVEEKLDTFYHALERYRDAGLTEQPRGAQVQVPPEQPPGIPPAPPPPPPIRV
jgi:hypothetical protein